jgi:K+ transporter
VSIAVAGVFMTIDVAFVAANLVKIVDGGWAPLMPVICSTVGR